MMGLRNASGAFPTVAQPGTDGFPSGRGAFLPDAALGHVGFLTVNFSQVFDLQREALSKLGFYTRAHGQEGKEKKRVFKRKAIYSAFSAVSSHGSSGHLCARRGPPVSPGLQY